MKIKPIEKLYRFEGKLFVLYSDYLNKIEEFANKLEDNIRPLLKIKKK